MKVLCFGKRSGTFTSKETGEVIEYFKISCLSPIENIDRDGSLIVGKKCSEFSIAQNLFDSLPDKFDDYSDGIPLDLEFNQYGRIIDINFA